MLEKGTEKVTKEFIEQAKQDSLKFGELYDQIFPNIFQFVRWRVGHKENTEDIVSDVPMFSLSRDGLNDAVTILRGQPFPPGVSIYGRKNT